MLVFCKENMPKLTINKWKFSDPEEEEAEEEMDMEEETQAAKQWKVLNSVDLFSILIN